MGGEEEEALERRPIAARSMQRQLPEPLGALACSILIFAPGALLLFTDLLPRLLSLQLAPPPPPGILDSASRSGTCLPAQPVCFHIPVPAAVWTALLMTLHHLPISEQ